MRSDGGKGVGEMKVKEMLESFLPDFEVPLLVSFSYHMKNYGLSTRVEFDFWDMHVYEDGDDALISVRTVNNHVNSATLQKVVTADTPYKVVLVEGNRINLARIENQSRFLAMAGVGVYVRDVGWAVLPGLPKVSIPEDAIYRMIDKYSQDETGEWGKYCTKCGAWTPVDGFYRSAQPNSMDPRRNLCKSCFNGG